MSDTKSASAMFEILGKAMDEVAREFRAVDRDDPKRGPLLKELSANSEVLSSPNLSRVFVVAQTAKAHKLRPVIRVGIRDRNAVGPRPLRKPFLADGFFVSSAGFKFLEIARPGNPQLAVD